MLPRNLFPLLAVLLAPCSALRAGVVSCCANKPTSSTTDVSQAASTIADILTPSRERVRIAKEVAAAEAAAAKAAEEARIAAEAAAADAVAEQRAREQRARAAQESINFVDTFFKAAGHLASDLAKDIAKETDLSAVAKAAKVAAAEATVAANKAASKAASKAATAAADAWTKASEMAEDKSWREGWLAAEEQTLVTATRQAAARPGVASHGKLASALDAARAAGLNDANDAVSAALTTLSKIETSLRLPPRPPLEKADLTRLKEETQVRAGEFKARAEAKAAAAATMSSDAAAEEAAAEEAAAQRAAEDEAAAQRAAAEKAAAEVKAAAEAKAHRKRADARTSAATSNDAIKETGEDSTRSGTKNPTSTSAFRDDGERELKRMRRRRAEEETARRRADAIRESWDEVRDVLDKLEQHDGDSEALSSEEAERLAEVQARVQAQTRQDAATAVGDLGKSLMGALLDGGLSEEAQTARRAKAREEAQAARLDLFGAEMDALGIPRDAAGTLDESTLRAAHRDRSRALHPDMQPQAVAEAAPAEGGDGLTIYEVNKAYQALKALIE